MDPASPAPARAATLPPNASRPCALLDPLLPPGIATAELVGEADAMLLPQAERRLLGGSVAARASAFAAGRLCARSAAAQFGAGDAVIGARRDRRARWPARLTGSITHTSDFAAAAVGGRQRFRAIGIDAERVGRLTRALWGYVLLPAEIAWLGGLPEEEQPRAATLAFSAKEAFYKCQYEVTQQPLAFHDVMLEFLGWRPDHGSFAVHPVGRVRLFDDVGGGPAIIRFAFAGDLVLTAMALPTR